MGNVLSEGTLIVINEAEEVSEIAGSSLQWDEIYDDPEGGGIVHVARINADEFGGAVDDFITLELVETEDGAIQGGEARVGKNSGAYEVDMEDLVVTIEEDLELGEDDD